MCLAMGYTGRNTAADRFGQGIKDNGQKDILVFFEAFLRRLADNRVPELCYVLLTYLSKCITSQREKRMQEGDALRRA